MILVYQANRMDFGLKLLHIQPQTTTVTFQKHTYQYTHSLLLNQHNRPKSPINNYFLCRNSQSPRFFLHIYRVHFFQIVKKKKSSMRNVLKVYPIIIHKPARRKKKHLTWNSVYIYIHLVMLNLSTFNLCVFNIYLCAAFFVISLILTL